MSTKNKFVLGALLVVFGIIVYINLADKHGKINVENPQPEVVERVVTPDWGEDEDAVAAAKAVIRRKELQAELDTLTVEREGINERITEIEKELGTY